MNDRKLKVLDLFSGIGGFSLGLERTGGFETVAFCEIEPFQRELLALRWPGVPIFHDVQELKADDLGTIDIITGGFPCQDISVAGRGAGIDGARSGLWREIARLVDELRPQYLIVENSSALLSRGFGRVLGDLAQIGYDAEWECIPAAAVGAPHIRDRVWILAYPRQELRHDVRGKQRHGFLFPQRDNRPAPERGEDWELITMVPGVHPRKAAEWWLYQSCMARAADGLPRQLDRVGSLGNAVVPAIPEIIGRAILKAEGIEMTSDSGAPEE